MLGGREHALGGGVLDDPPRIHHGDLVGHLRDHAEIVGDQHERHPPFALQAREQREHLRLHGHVERGRRLVGDQQLGVARERHRDHRALALPARELVRIGVDAHRRLGNADEVQQLDRARARRGLGDVSVRPDRLHDLRAHAIHRVQ